MEKSVDPKPILLRQLEKQLYIDIWLSGILRDSEPKLYQINHLFSRLALVLQSYSGQLKIQWTTDERGFVNRVSAWISRASAVNRIERIHSPESNKITNIEGYSLFTWFILEIYFTGITKEPYSSRFKCNRSLHQIAAVTVSDIASPCIC